MSAPLTILFISFVSTVSSEINDFPDPAEIDPLSVLIKEVKERLQTVSNGVEKDIFLLQSSGNETSGEPGFPSPKPLFEGIFTDEQLERTAKISAQLNKRNRLDDRARMMVDRLLFLNERGVDITGPSGGYHRSIGGGYIPPQKYEPNNVHWYSYMDEGRTINPIDDYGRNVFQMRG